MAGTSGEQSGQLAPSATSDPGDENDRDPQHHMNDNAKRNAQQDDDGTALSRAIQPFSEHCILNVICRG